MGDVARLSVTLTRLAPAGVQPRSIETRVGREYEGARETLGGDLHSLVRWHLHGRSRVNVILGLQHISNLGRIAFAGTRRGATMPLMTTRLPAAPARGGDLQPVEHRATWVAWGLALQAIGVGIPVTVALRHANHDGVLGSVTHYTIRLVLHEMLRSHAYVALILLGVAVYVAGAVIMARPFCSRKSRLLTAVPVVAIVGLAVLGVLAVVCAAIIALAQDSSGVEAVLNGISWPGTDGRKRRK